GGGGPLGPLRARHLVHEVEVDVGRIRCPLGALAHQVRLPDLLCQRAGHLELLVLPPVGGCRRRVGTRSDALSTNRSLCRTCNLTKRDVSIDLWTILAESAYWTRPRPYSEHSRPVPPPWRSWSPRPASPARRRTASRSRSSITGSWPVTCRAGSCWARASTSSRRPPVRTACSPPRTRCSRPCATTPASPRSSTAARATIASAWPPPSVPSVCATRSRSAPR